MNALLYISIILLWGFTWIAMKAQVGIVPVEVSLFYRFAIAAVVIFFIMLIKRVSFKFSLRQHAFMMALGALLFSTNFLFIYQSVLHLASGLVAILFSTSVIMIMLNRFVFFKEKISYNRMLGAMIGLLGLGVIFWPELKAMSLTGEMITGLLLGLIGTYCFSWGNQISSHCARLSIPLLASTFYGMCYGVLFTGLYCWMRHIPYAIDYSVAYLSALIYLAIPGSVMGFLIYLGLIKRLGPERAAYATFFFPLVALVVSVFAEAYEWQLHHVLAILLILVGNAMVLFKPKWKKST